MTKKTFFLDQHGCAKNQVDGELLVTRLLNAGYVQSQDASDADIIIINTCGFIESAKQESLNALMNMRASFPKAKILLAGCLAQRYAQVFKEELPEADGIFGNGDLSLIEDTVKKMLDDKRPVVTPEQNGVCCGDRNVSLSFPGSAYVKITEGCNNRCTFCAIPLIRGSLRSRPAKQIVSEIQDLVNRGAREINLIGQDLAAYGTGEKDSVFEDSAAFSGHSALYGLLKSISGIKGKFWVRMLYIHPDHFNPDILEILKQDERILPYFDIPFQSGSDEIIKKMNRRGTQNSYIALVKNIRSVFPDFALRTTFLTGFPGETDKDALLTESFLTAIEPDWSGCFAYSREEDTPAYSFKGRVSKKQAQERAQKLTQIQESITQKKLLSRTGKFYDVLIEEIIENASGTDEGLAIGRAWFQAPEVDGSVVVRYDLDDAKAVKDIVPGNVVKVKAVASSALDIDGVYFE